jgi:hypothetical protein
MADLDPKIAILPKAFFFDKPLFAKALRIQIWTALSRPNQAGDGLNLRGAALPDHRLIVILRSIAKKARLNRKASAILHRCAGPISTVP